MLTGSWRVYYHPEIIKTSGGLYKIYECHISLHDAPLAKYLNYEISEIISALQKKYCELVNLQGKLNPTLKSLMIFLIN